MRKSIFDASSDKDIKVDLTINVLEITFLVSYWVIGSLNSKDIILSLIVDHNLWKSSSDLSASITERAYT